MKYLLIYVFVVFSTISYAQQPSYAIPTKELPKELLTDSVVLIITQVSDVTGEMYEEQKGFLKKELSNLGINITKFVNGSKYGATPGAISDEMFGELDGYNIVINYLSLPASGKYMNILIISPYDSETKSTGDYYKIQNKKREKIITELQEVIDKQLK